MVGFGYDCHRFKSGNGIIIGGVIIPCDYEYIAHSDGDVLYHSLCDALLGASGLGDIGEHFPDNDEIYKGKNSDFFVSETINMLEERNYKIVNIDISLILEKPKLKAFKLQMKKNIAKLCKIDEKFVNIKAKTSEKMGFVGRGEGIESYCICELK